MTIVTVLRPLRLRVCDACLAQHQHRYGPEVGHAHYHNERTGKDYCYEHALALFGGDEAEMEAHLVKVAD